MYQLWGHKMFPKLQFRETVDRVEKLCRSRRVMVSFCIILLMYDNSFVKIAMSGYRDAEKKGPEQDEENDDDVGINVIPDSREGSPASEQQQPTGEEETEEIGVIFRGQEAQRSVIISIYILFASKLFVLPAGMQRMRLTLMH